MDTVKRFIRYAEFGTQSDPNSGLHPSTPVQTQFARKLVEELKEIGFENPHMDEHSYVYAWIPATPGMENIPVLGLVSHMDTSDAVPGAPVKPAIVHFDGNPIRLNERVTLKPLDRYKGLDLIVTDGNTLLGADDKAGVAEIVTACEYLLAHPEKKHGRIAVAFTPDEEIGEGTVFFDVDGFGAQIAYTVDGGTIGEVEYECFNAASCVIYCNGVNCHPGSGKGNMRNSILFANEFLAMLPPEQTPANSEGYEGFFHVNYMSGDENRTEIRMIIRDHNSEKFEQKKALVKSIESFLNAKYGQGTVEVVTKDGYRNMKEKILPHMDLIENAYAAMKSVGIDAQSIPIRGGTDGADLSYRGLPCPNLCTGGENFHSLTEYIPVDSLQKMTQVLIELICMQK